jgi:hypothetical protein
VSEPEKEKADAEANAEANADAEAKADASTSTSTSTPTSTPTSTSPSTATPTANDDAETGDLVFDTMWSRVLEAWDDDKPHGVIVEYAVRMQKLPELAGKYKALTNDPEKKARAQKRLDGVVMAATHLLMSMKTPPPPKSNKLVNLVAAIVAVALVSYLAYKMIVFRGGAP